MTTDPGMSLPGGYLASYSLSNGRDIPEPDETESRSPSGTAPESREVGAATDGIPQRPGGASGILFRFDPSFSTVEDFPSAGRDVSSPVSRVFHPPSGALLRVFRREAGVPAGG